MAESRTCPACHAGDLEPGWTHCPHCGQPLGARRIDWAFIRTELTRTLLRADKGFLYTLGQLFRRPGGFLRDYVAGLRTGHVKPLTFLLITAVAYATLTFLLGGTPTGEGFAAGARDAMANRTSSPEEVAMAAMFASAKDWMDRHYGLVAALLVPFEAFAFRLVFRRFRVPNLPEWIVIVAYITGAVLVLRLPGALLEAWIPAVESFVMLLGVGFMVWVLIRYFRPYPWWKTLLRSILGLLFFWLMNATLLFAVGIGLGTWMALN